MKKDQLGDKRIIADMSNMDDRGLLGTWFGILDPNVRAKHGPGREVNPDNQRVQGDFHKRNLGMDNDLSPEDRRALIKFALKYSFGIGMVFLIAFGIVIFLMTKFWT